MERFNVKEFISNEETPVIRRDGRKATILCSDLKGEFPVAFRYGYNDEEESVMMVLGNGKAVNGEFTPDDLYFAPKKNIDIVDLALPSGTKWMKCNIGATKETDYGLYFQWGDTVGYTGDEAKNNSTWATAPFNNGSSGYDSTYWASVKSTVLDKNNCLLPAYDAAYQATKGAAKMPTKEQFEELVNNTTFAWVTTYNGVNVTGATFTANGNTLFIPAAGFYYSGSFYNEGYELNCWGSSLFSSSESVAWGLYGYEDEARCSHYRRYYGFSVRGVQC